MLIVNILLLADGIAFLVYLMQTKKELTKKKKKKEKKRKDYSISLEKTQQKRRKKLRQTSNLLAGNEPCVPELVNVFLIFTWQRI